MQAAWGNIGAQWLAQGHLSNAQEVVIYQCTLLAACWSGTLISDPPVPKPGSKPPSVSALTADFD